MPDPADAPGRGRRSPPAALSFVAGALLALAAPQAAREAVGGSASLPLALLLATAVFAPAATLPLEVLHRAFRSGRLFLLALVMDWFIGPALLVSLALLLFRARAEIVAGVALLALCRGFSRGTAECEEIGGERDFASGLAGFRAIFLALFAPVYVLLLASAVPEAACGAPPLPLSRVLLAAFCAIQAPVALGLLFRMRVRRAIGAAEYDRNVVPRLRGITLLAACLASFAAGFCAAPALAPLLLFAPVAAAIFAHGFVACVAAFFLAMDFNADYERAAPIALSGVSGDGALVCALAAALFGLSHPAALIGALALALEDPLVAFAMRIAPRFRRRYGLPR